MYAVSYFAFAFSSRFASTLSMQFIIVVCAPAVKEMAQHNSVAMAVAVFMFG